MPGISDNRAGGVAIAGLLASGRWDGEVERVVVTRRLAFKLTCDRIGAIQRILHIHITDLNHHMRTVHARMLVLDSEVGQEVSVLAMVLAH